MSSWKASGSERHNCTNEDIKPEDLTKPCQLFIRELEFIKKLDQKRNQSNMKKVKFVHSALIINSMCSVQEGTYQDQDINELTKLTGAPIEIEIRIKSKDKNKNKKNSINFHCGKTELSEKEKKTGWCATKLDRQGEGSTLRIDKLCSSSDKIERWGFCRESCTDQRDSFMFANMNLLTDDECYTLFRQVRSAELI